MAGRGGTVLGFNLILKKNLNKKSARFTAEEQNTAETS